MHCEKCLLPQVPKTTPEVPDKCVIGAQTRNILQASTPFPVAASEPIEGLFSISRLAFVCRGDQRRSGAEAIWRGGRAEILLVAT
eukprot:3790241-Amphidinium_carterae.1